MINNEESFLITEFKTEREEDLNKRLDIFVSEKLNITRSQVKNYLSSIKVNGQKKKLSYLLKLNDIIIIENEKKFIKENSKEEPKAENISLNIIYEDKYLIIINKPNNMSVHCSASEMSGTLIHRLDKDTSGLIIIGKNANIVSSIQEQFKKRTVKKIYHAILVGILKENFLEINLPIGRHSLYRKKMTVREDGKEALTYMKVLRRFKNHTLAEINLKTGRTHQIRVHSSYRGFPIAGDKIYSKSFSKYKGLMLLSKEIEFMHPITKEKMNFEIDYPEYFKNFLHSNEI